ISATSGSCTSAIHRRPASRCQTGITTHFKLPARARSVVVVATQEGLPGTAISSQRDAVAIGPWHYASIGAAHLNQVGVQPGKTFVCPHFHYIEATMTASPAAKAVFL